MVDSKGPNVIVATDNPFNDDKWHHMGVVREGGSLSIYIDGNMENSQQGNIGSVTETQTFGIQLGRKMGNRDMYKGILDEFRLWNRALSKDEIKANMTKGKEQFLAVEPDDHLTTMWGDVKIR